MRYRRLDPASGDYMFGSGQQDFYVNQPEAVGQSVFTRLMLWQGQWFYDLTEGTPWQTQVLGERTRATRDLVVRQRVLTTPQVVDITEYASYTDPSTRTFSASITIDTAYGTVTVLAPTLPATPPTLGAQLLGITGTRNPVDAVPAVLAEHPRADITKFNVEEVDAGVFP